MNINEQIIEYYNEQHPEKPISNIDDMPIPTENIVNLIKMFIEHKIENIENPFGICKVNTVLLDKDTILPKIELSLYIVNETLYKVTIEEINIDELLEKLGIPLKIAWFFWEYGSRYETVKMDDGTHTTLFKLYAYQW